MYGIKHPGFSILELLVVLLIIGLITSVSIPLIHNVLNRNKNKSFLMHMNGLVQLAWQQSLAQQQAHRLLFDFTKQTVIVEEAQTNPDAKGNIVWKALRNSFVTSEYAWSSELVLESLIIDGVDYLARAGVKTETAWLYVSSEGICQSAFITVRDSSISDKQAATMTIALNPFTVQFSLYEKPIL